MPTLTIGRRGRFTFLAPYDTIYDSGKVYTIQSLRSIREMVVSNDKPFDIYKKAGLTETDFYNDLDNDVQIVTLVSENDEWIQIPASYLDSNIVEIGVEYQNYSIAFNLAPLPVTMDLNPIADEIVQYLIDRLGVDIDYRIVETSDVYLLTQAEHKLREGKRQKRIQLEESIFTRYRKLLTQNASIIEHISRLECFIKDLLCTDGYRLPIDDTAYLPFNFVETERRPITDVFYLTTQLG